MNIHYGYLVFASGSWFAEDKDTAERFRIPSSDIDGDDMHGDKISFTVEENPRRDIKGRLYATNIFPRL